jgi:hypothetical protein
LPSGDGGITISAARPSLQDSAGRGGSGGDGAQVLLGQVISLDSGGDLINCYMWDPSAGDWSTSATQIYKPYILCASTYTGYTITYTDGAVIAYNTTDLVAAYERRAVWDGGDSEEIQVITSPYFAGEILCIAQNQVGNMIDTNQAGRHWAEL